MMEEKRKSIFITGASRGFGLALTKHFILNQWNAVALVRNKKDAMSLEKISEARCFPIISDITINNVQISIQESLKSLKIFGNIDLLINNAGIGSNSAFFSETTADELESNILTSVSHFH